MGLIATLCFRLQEITTPALGAPPLLIQEGVSQSIFIFRGEPKAHGRLCGKAAPLRGVCPPKQPPPGTAQFVRLVRSFGVRQLAATFLPRACSRDFEPVHHSQPASWLLKKRQQAAALQSFAPNASMLALLRPAGRQSRWLTPASLSVIWTGLKGRHCCPR